MTVLLLLCYADSWRSLRRTCWLARSCQLTHPKSLMLCCVPTFHFLLGGAFQDCCLWGAVRGV
jgi:hypothetical protein